jgi:hypothetical protein
VTFRPIDDAADDRPPHALSIAARVRERDGRKTPFRLTSAAGTASTT